MLDVNVLMFFLFLFWGGGKVCFSDSNFVWLWNFSACLVEELF